MLWNGLEDPLVLNGMWKRIWEICGMCPLLEIRCMLLPSPPAPTLPAARLQLEAVPPSCPPPPSLLLPVCMQLEAIPPYFWVCGWRCYLAFFPQYLDKHIAAASAMGKPFVVEEFNVLLQ